jgi:hypothetical protein
VMQVCGNTGHYLQIVGVRSVVDQCDSPHEKWKYSTSSGPLGKSIKHLSFGPAQCCSPLELISSAGRTGT